MGKYGIRIVIKNKDDQITDIYEQKPSHHRTSRNKFYDTLQWMFENAIKESLDGKKVELQTIK